jgi:hypothetical protein
MQTNLIEAKWGLFNALKAIGQLKQLERAQL